MPTVNTEYAGVLVENIAKLNNDAEKVTLVSAVGKRCPKVRRNIKIYLAVRSILSIDAFLFYFTE